MATQEPFIFDAGGINNFLKKYSHQDSLKKYQLDKAYNLAGFFVMGRKAIDKFIGKEKRVNTDNLPLNELYSLEKKFNRKREKINLSKYQSSIEPYLVNCSEFCRQKIKKEQRLAKALFSFYSKRLPVLLLLAKSINPQDKNVLYWMGKKIVIYPWDKRCKEYFSLSE